VTTSLPFSLSTNPNMWRFLSFKKTVDIAA
jgi:hypothetical protein